MTAMAGKAETHVPVLLDEAVAALAVKRGGRYVDGTLGRAGHARAVAGLGGLVLGIDRDEQALREVAGMQIEGLTAVKGNHGDVFKIANDFGWSYADGVLLDLGVSSPQLDEAGRGFSFMRDGPLDMRMDRSCGVSAAEIVNGESEERLEAIFRTFGEEPQSRRIAKALVRARAKGRRFESTAELAGFVESVTGRRGPHHPATRVFQALRMEVNDEIGELRRALAGALELLAAGGRLAVISFESLTDRETKAFFALHAGREVALQQGGSEWRGERPRVRLVTRRAVKASAEESAANPRSRSARLRVAEKE